MQFERIDLAKSTRLSLSLRRWARQSKPFLSAVHASFKGRYRSGSEGAPDAHYICGILRIVCDVWHPDGVILDFSQLSYDCGDEMARVTVPPDDIAFAVVVGPKCERAISMLSTIPLEKREGFFRSDREAIAYIRRNLVQRWNSSVKKHPEWLKDSDQITEDDL